MTTDLTTEVLTTAVLAMVGYTPRVLVMGVFGLVGAAVLSCGVDAPSGPTRTAEQPEKRPRCASKRAGACEPQFAACVRGAAERAHRCYEHCKSDGLCEEHCNSAAVTTVAACRTEREGCEAK